MPTRATSITSRQLISEGFPIQSLEHLQSSKAMLPTIRVRVYIRITMDITASGKKTPIQTMRPVAS